MLLPVGIRHFPSRGGGACGVIGLQPGCIPHTQVNVNGVACYRLRAIRQPSDTVVLVSLLHTAIGPLKSFSGSASLGFSTFGMGCPSRPAVVELLVLWCAWTCSLDS